MRGGDRLVRECGWMNGVCFSFLPFNRDFLNFLALATPHQPALTVPKCRQVRQLPPGGSQGEVAAADSMQRTQLFRKLRVANLATPTAFGSFWLTATNGGHSLSFAFAQQLPQRGSQGHFVPAGGYEPPLHWRCGTTNRHHSGAIFPRSKSRGRSLSMNLTRSML